MRINGIIHSIDLDDKVIGIKTYKRVEFFYLKNSQMNLFKKYLYKGNYIDLVYDEDHIVTKNTVSAYVVSYVMVIKSLDRFKSIVYYDKASLNKSLYKFLNDFGNVMFLDLEMTMPSYSFKGHGFQTELIQAGFIIIGTDGEEICRYSNYVKPTISKTISKRVEKFLNIDPIQFEAQAITYKKFYADFLEVLDNYHPAIVVYGKNDIKVMNESYAINGCESLQNKTRYINLCQIIKNFYDLKNDPGLFKLYKIYYECDDIQVHDAFTDSYVTAKVFEAFKKDVAGKINKAGDIRRELE